MTAPGRGPMTAPDRAALILARQRHAARPMTGHAALTRLALARSEGTIAAGRVRLDGHTPLAPTGLTIVRIRRALAASPRLAKSTLFVLVQARDLG